MYSGCEIKMLGLNLFSYCRLIGNFEEMDKYINLSIININHITTGSHLKQMLRNCRLMNSANHSIIHKCCHLIKGLIININHITKSS